MMKQYSILLLAGFTALLFACKKSDIERPIVSIDSPADSAVFASGQTLPFVATFLDNRDLGQYKIDIHDNFDNHASDKYIAPVWSELFIQTISGSQYNENRSIPIPDSAASGWYHFQVIVGDRVGNQSVLVTRNIYIQNQADSTAPTLTVASPIEGFSGALGDTLSFDVNAGDNEWVYIVKMRLLRSGSTTILFQSNDTLDVSTTANVAKYVPATGSAWTAGSYVLTVTVYDSYFNATVKQVTFSLN